MGLALRCCESLQPLSNWRTTLAVVLPCLAMGSLSIAVFGFGAGLDLQFESVAGVTLAGPRIALPLRLRGQAHAATIVPSGTFSPSGRAICGTPSPRFRRCGFVTRAGDSPSAFRN